MRSSVIPENILSEPTDLRFLQPTGIGFLNKSKLTILFRSGDSKNGEVKSLVADIEIKMENRREALLNDINRLADHVDKKEPETGSYWVLEYLPEYSDNILVIFSSFDNGSTYQKHVGSPKVLEFRWVELWVSVHAISLLTIL